MRAQGKTSTQYKHVYFYFQTNKYSAQKSIDGKHYNFGMHQTAKAAYDHMTARMQEMMRERSAADDEVHDDDDASDKRKEVDHQKLCPPSFGYTRSEKHADVFHHAET